MVGSESVAPGADGGSSRATRSASTLRDYEADWVRFGLWCAVLDLEALPADPSTVASYLAHLAPVWRPATAGDPPDAIVRSPRSSGRSGGRSSGEVCQRPGLAPGTLVRHLAAIAAHHDAAGRPNPTRDRRVVDALSRIRRRAESPALWRVAPAVTPKVLALVDGLDTGRDPAAARDTALILVGYTAALRRRELAALTLDQVAEDPERRWIEVATAPVDPGGTSAVTRVPAVGGPGCPVAAWICWRGWLGASDAEDAGHRAGGGPAPAFRSIRKGRPPRDGDDDGRAVACRRIGADALTERSIARIVGFRAETAGLLGPSGRSGRSLRQGLESAADGSGLPV